MASHGKVFDLFDDRYLELQDVMGNVEPLPMLVPYEQYRQHLIIYRMDTSHEIFLALLQDFTDRKAFETGKELWTWCVQWEVDETATRQSLVVPHSPKKPRLDTVRPNLPPAQRLRRNGAPITAQARVIDPELIREEDMLRILVDIVQVDSAVVPNFIEFLYRWIDFYEGDGKALKAALRGEIPSLWDFEYHPLVVSEDVKKRVNEANDDGDDVTKSETGSRTPEHSNAQELAQNSPTKKMRQKPDLAELERKAEESERLQYREVHFGIQPPKLNEPLPPLINIPRDPKKRAKYHAACFKSRQRAFYMLMEVGITPQHMRDYNRCQKQSVRDTPPVDGDGLKNYEQDAHIAQQVFLEKEKQIKKQMEIAISHQLAVEAQTADHSAAPEESSGAPLIPPTPSYTPLPDIAEHMQRKIQQHRLEGKDKINIVPTPLVGKMKSKLFQGARDRETVLESLKDSPVTPTPRHTIISDEEGPGTDDSENENSASDRMRIMTPAQHQVASLSVPFPYSAPSITVPPPQAPNGGSQNQLPGNFGGHAPFIAQPSAGPSHPSPYSYPVLSHGTQTGGLNIAGNFHGIPSITSGHGTSQVVPTQSLYPFAQQPHNHMQNVNRQTQGISHPVLGLSNPAPLSGVTQGLIAIQQAQGNHAPVQGQQQPPFSLSRAGAPGSNGANQNFMPSGQQQPPHLYPPSAASLTTFRPGMQRIAPSPLTFIPPPSPFSSLAPSLLATSPFGISHASIPVQIYFPGVVVPPNTIGPGGAKLGNKGNAETDAFLLGHTQPGSGKITLSKAIFLPVGVWPNATERVRKGKYTVLESYPAPGPRMPNYTTGTPHQAAYKKMEQAYGFMVCSNPAARERELTKRWRVSRGRMTASERGAVWEGWAVELDREISLSREERRGAVLHDMLIDGKAAVDSDRERRRREIEEMLEQEEAMEDESSDMDIYE
ncbi:uncharacterized protein SETTUDRAFT_85284 [Exserohilum turcica Et28A]|uniref:Uncharacterized protein n=1 Tax=Exserohilum turcicum (strain 28A) TaxID=671987 RepID=R0KHE9_EXST2|nr:uncharacterized protein SETTUDRAFT_85284 [Exserohilum turcica Et28A]EOA92318.1 hypothetical protein SETTUDRAFT_85284 [Exserohilum turcica Et28A]